MKIERVKRQSPWQRFSLTGLLLGLLWLSPAFAAETTTLNFKDADIRAVISTIAETTGKNFIIDPRVKGKVTLISNR